MYRSTRHGISTHGISETSCVCTTRTYLIGCRSCDGPTLSPTYPKRPITIIIIIIIIRESVQKSESWDDGMRNLGSSNPTTCGYAEKKEKEDRKNSWANHRTGGRTPSSVPFLLIRIPSQRGQAGSAGQRLVGLFVVYPREFCWSRSHMDRFPGNKSLSRVENRTSF